MCTSHLQGEAGNLRRDLLSSDALSGLARGEMRIKSLQFPERFYLFLASGNGLSVLEDLDLAFKPGNGENTTTNSSANGSVVGLLQGADHGLSRGIKLSSRPGN